MTNNEKHMHRADMWAHFKELTVPAYKPGRKRADKDSAQKHVRYRCIVNGDRLIMGVWIGADARFSGVYYMTASGQTNVTMNGTDWTQGKACYVAMGGWSYWNAYSTYGYKYECVSGSDEASDWINKHWAEYSWFYKHTEIIRDLDSIEDHIAGVRRMNAEKRRIEKWSNWAKGLPPLPVDFESWARKVAFGGLEYAFGDKDSNKYFCTACGKMHTSKSWKHRGRYECSRTGKKIKVEKIEKGAIKRSERLMLVQSYKTINGEICSVARHFTAWAEWDRKGSRMRIYSDAILVLRYDGSTVCGDDILYCIGDNKWDVRNTSMFQHAKCYCYPDVSALKGTVYEDIGIDAAAQKGWKLHYNNLMRGWYNDPRMEYLIKGNFKQLVDDKTSKNSHVVSLMPGDNVQSVLGIDGQGVARLRQANGGELYLDWLRAVYMSYSIKHEKGAVTIKHGKISEDTIRFFVAKKITVQNVAFALNMGMSPEQIANYLKKDHGYRLENKRWMGNKEHVTISQWRDYLNMAEKLKLDTSRESIYKPKNLRERHDELTELLNAKKAQIEAERIESEYPAIGPVCAKIKELYEWGDGEYQVIVPSGAADIQREGRLLSHCVGTTDRYFDRMAEEESYIMFLRKSKSPKSPWYTMEVEPGGAVRQLRTFGDDEGKDRAEAKAFLKKMESGDLKARGTS